MFLDFVERSRMTFHVGFMIFRETAWQDSYCADGTSDVRKLATSVGALTCSFVFRVRRGYELWTRSSIQRLRPEFVHMTVVSGRRHVVPFSARQ
jgi:hypothetical protein